MRKQPQDDRKQLIAAALAAHPNGGTTTIAKLLHKQYPLLFPTLEIARSAVRYRRGAKGAELRRNIPPEDVRVWKPGMLKLPKGESRGRKPLVISEGHWCILSDIHAPYHHEQSIEAAVRDARDAGCEHLYLNGDSIDFYPISVFVSDPLKRQDLPKELAALHEILAVLAKAFPGRKVYKLGNHEERLTNYVWQRTPELALLPQFNVDAVLGLKARGYEVVQSRQYAQLGNLLLYHGHELKRGLTRNVNIARGLWLKVRDSCVAGHWHAASTHIESAGMQKMKTCYSLGCLCDMVPDYAMVNEWNHGYGRCRVNGKKYNFTNLLIDDGRIYGA